MGAFSVNPCPVPGTWQPHTGPWSPHLVLHLPCSWLGPRFSPQGHQSLHQRSHRTPVSSCHSLALPAHPQSITIHMEVPNAQRCPSAALLLAGWWEGLCLPHTTPGPYTPVFWETSATPCPDTDFSTLSSCFPVLSYKSGCWEWRISSKTAI